MKTDLERKITETVLVDWLPDPSVDPRRCACGHLHFARIPRAVPGPHAARLVGSGWAPQWTWCEDPGCGCRSLKPCV